MDTARAPVIVFVDDDNVLQREYLAHVRDIAAKNPQLGAWGRKYSVRSLRVLRRSGRVRIGVSWQTARFRRTASRVRYRTIPPPLHSAPACVYDTKWRSVTASSCQNRRSGRVSTARDSHCASAGDIDLALTACEMGLDAGVFARLELIHLIPPERLTEDYLLAALQKPRHVLATAATDFVASPCGDCHEALSGGARSCTTAREKTGRERRFYLAQVRGQRAALRAFSGVTNSQ